MKKNRLDRKADYLQGVFFELSTQKRKQRNSKKYKIALVQLENALSRGLKQKDPYALKKLHLGKNVSQRKNELDDLVGRLRRSN